MTKADRYMREMILRIQKEGYRDINPRPKYADGTPAHTISVNHTFRSYDLSKGEFPICSLRPMAWKTGIREIMAIYQNQSNKISEFERLGCGWWKDWALEDGTIGKSYPYNLESHRPNEMKRTKAMLKTLKKAMQTLTPIQKRTVYKLFVKNMSQAEIAREEGLTKMALTYRVAGIYAKLKKYLEKNF